MSELRFYSPAWVTAANEVLASMTEDLEGGTSWRMLQVVDGAPDGRVRLALVVDGSADGPAAHFELDPPEDAPAQVTVSVAYDDAAALSRGELDPAQLLATGRVRVRGDLSVLVKGQAVLIAVAGRVAALARETTY